MRQQYKYQVMRNCCVNLFSTMDVYATTPWIHETNFTLHEGIYAEKVIYICMSLCLFFHHNVGIRFHPISIKNDYISSIIWNIQSIAWMEGSESWNKLQELSVLNLPIHAKYSKQKRHSVGVYRQAYSGIPLAVGFVGRDRRLWNSMVQGTRRFRQFRVVSCVIPYVLCGGLYCLRCRWLFVGGPCPPLYIRGGQGYMESSSRV